MTPRQVSIFGQRLRVHPVRGQSAPIEYLAGSAIEGLMECEKYELEVPDCQQSRVFVDDVEVPRNAHGRHEWSPAFYAGRVEIVVIVEADTETQFCAYIGPSSSKVTDEQFEAMVCEIREFRASLLLGTSSAAMAFGDSPVTSGLSNHLRLDRLRLHAPQFLRDIRAICQLPHRALCQIEGLVPLARVKRLSPFSLRDPRIAAIVSGQMPDSAEPDSLPVITAVPVQTFDTPSNRALKALLARVIAHAGELLVAVSQGKLGGDPEEQALRRLRRERFLSRLIDEAKVLLKQEPFWSVSRAETSAASLTQISAQPAYGRAYRRGTRALLRSIGGSPAGDPLRISPTWGVYETWSFVHLLANLSKLFGQSPWKAFSKGIVSAAESCVLELSDGTCIEAHFQANFTAGGPSSNRVGWSLSRLRIPDIVIVIRTATRLDFIVLDAKYRSKRDNILGAMESAHIYHDSLRLSRQRPAFCALLLPGVADVPSLDEDSFLFEHGVGTISGFTSGGVGVSRCIRLIAQWVNSSGN